MPTATTLPADYTITLDRAAILRLWHAWPKEHVHDYCRIAKHDPNERDWRHAIIIDARTFLASLQCVPLEWRAAAVIFLVDHADETFVTPPPPEELLEQADRPRGTFDPCDPDSGLADVGGIDGRSAGEVKGL